MMSSRFVSAAVLAGLTASVMAQPRGGRGGEIPEIIRKVINASQKLRYSGKRNVEFQKGPDWDRHLEYVQKDGPKTRIEYPENGVFRGLVIVETERERRHYYPDLNQIEVLPPRREAMLSRLEKMFNRRRGRPIDIDVADGGTVAGRDTKLISILGPDGKPFQKIWVDESTYLVLKRVVYDRGGQAVGTSEYVSVDYRPKFGRNTFSLQVTGAKIVTPRNELDRLVAKMGFQGMTLPPKDPYKLESCRIQRIAGQSALVQNYVNADGQISLYQVRGALDPKKLREFSRGDFGVYCWQEGGASFVLIGDLPTDALRKIADRVTS